MNKINYRVDAINALKCLMMIIIFNFIVSASLNAGEYMFICSIWDDFESENPLDSWEIIDNMPQGGSIWSLYTEGDGNHFISVNPESDINHEYSDTSIERNEDRVDSNSNCGNIKISIGFEYNYKKILDEIAVGYVYVYGKDGEVLKSMDINLDSTSGWQGYYGDSWWEGVNEYIGCGVYFEYKNTVPDKGFILIDNIHAYVENSETCECDCDNDEEKTNDDDDDENGSCCG